MRGSRAKNLQRRKEIDISKCHRGVYQRAGSQRGCKLQTPNNSCCRGTTRWERCYRVALLKKGCCRRYWRKERREKEVVGHTSGPGGPGNPTGPLSPTFPCRKQKNMEKGDSWLLAFLFRIAQLHWVVFPAGHWTFRQDTRKQRTLGYLPGDLLSLAPQGPRANPGCPEKRHTHFYQEAQWSIKKHQFPSSSSSFCSREALSKGETQPARSWDSYINVSEVFLLKPDCI